MDLEDELLNLIGHKLRQNLINVAELSTLVLADGGSAMTDVVRSDVAQIRTQAEEALSTIDDVLRLARSCYTPGAVSIIGFDSILNEVVPRSTQAVLGDTTRLHISTKLLSVGACRGDVTAFEHAITSVLTVMNALYPGSDVHCAARMIDTMVVLNFQTSTHLDFSTPVLIKNIFKHRNVNTIIEMLTCFRLIRSCGGQVIMLQRQNDQGNLAFQLHLPCAI